MNIPDFLATKITVVLFSSDTAKNHEQNVPTPVNIPMRVEEKMFRSYCTRIDGKNYKLYSSFFCVCKTLYT